MFNMENSTEKGLKEALIYLESGNPSKARQILSQLFTADNNNQKVYYATLCCTFWEGILSGLSLIEDPLERGDTLLTEWKNFIVYIQLKTPEYKPAFESTKQGVFTLALQSFRKALEDINIEDKSGIYQKTGLCFKKTGDFENACRCLTQANNIHGGQASVLAELADCWSLCGDDRTAKVLFREAFYIAPDKIEMDHLDSQLIKALIKKTEETGCSPRSLAWWVPVYGVIWGVFTVRRTLSSQEVGHLKQAVYALENEYKNPKCDAEILMPRLLNSYFRLIEYYVMTGNSESQINEILLKMKVLNKPIYELYVK